MHEKCLQLKSHLCNHLYLCHSIYNFDNKNLSIIIIKTTTIIPLIRVVNLRRQRFLWWRVFKRERVRIIFINADSSARQTKSPREKGFFFFDNDRIFHRAAQSDKLENRFSQAFPCLSSCQNLKEEPLPFVTCLWTFRGSGCLLSSTRSGWGNGLLSECSEDHLIGHLNEVLSED